MSDFDKVILDYIDQSDVSGLKKYLEDQKLSVDTADEHGMTLLQHAAYKGNKEVCQALISMGADANCKKHEYDYTSLHFAALSGKPEVCQVLLEAGAKTHSVNSVGRTPAQMAAFVGNHSCVAVINTFIPKSAIEYYSVAHPPETEPKLDPSLVEPLHKLVSHVNLHPVRIALNLLPGLINHVSQIQKVLELISCKEIKKIDENEILAFKLHYIGFIVGQVVKFGIRDNHSNPVELFIKKIISGTKGEEWMDLLVREGVREFPFRDACLFREIVAVLSKTKDTNALMVVSQSLNGQRIADGDKRPCATCQEEFVNKKCSKCKRVQYCDRECQRLHWFVHKKECNRSEEPAQT